MKAAVVHSCPDSVGSEEETATADEVTAIREALGVNRIESFAVGMEMDLDAVRMSLEAWRPDCIFNLVECLEYTDRLILLAPLLYEHMGVPYTGVSLEGMMLSTNKIVAKRVLASHRIPTPDWICPEASGLGRWRARGGEARAIIKPVWEHASTRITPASVVDVEEARQAVRGERGNAAQFAERFIDGREFCVPLLERESGGVEVLPLHEILFEGDWDDMPRVVGYDAKWRPDSIEAMSIRRSFDFSGEDSGILESLATVAVRCWDVLKLSGYAKIDFRVDSRDRPWVLEAKANPRLSPGAGFMVSARRVGMDTGQVVSRLITCAMARR